MLALIMLTIDAYVTFEENMEQVYRNVSHGEAPREEAGTDERMPSLSGCPGNSEVYREGMCADSGGTLSCSNMTDCRFHVDNTHALYAHTHARTHARTHLITNSRKVKPQNLQRITYSAGFEDQSEIQTKS